MCRLLWFTYNKDKRKAMKKKRIEILIAQNSPSLIVILLRMITFGLGSVVNDPTKTQNKKDVAG